MADTTPPATDLASQYLFPSDRFSLEVTDRRVHDVAIQRWFNKKFLLREGVPCPVIFAGLMDAYAQFNRLQKGPNNPYAYLKELKEYPGLEPAPLRFPLISVEWKSMRYRPEQSLATRVNRRVYYPTVSKDVKLQDLGTVAQARYPSAYTFIYQIEFLCARPDTQASFARQLTRCFRVMSAGTPQTFIPVVWPGYFGAAAERLVLTSTIDNMTEHAPTDTEQQFRLSFTLELEGWAIDPDITVAPTFWYISVGENVLSPDDVDRYYDFHGVQVAYDMRTPPLENAVLIHRNLPPTS